MLEGSEIVVVAGVESGVHTAIAISSLHLFGKKSNPPGYEKEIRNLVLAELKGLADEVTVDNMGNVIAFKKRPLR